MKREQIKSPLLEDSEQENKTITIQKEEPKPNFIIVYETIYKNPKLTINEMGLLIKLISLAPTFKVNSKSLIKMLKISQREYFKASLGLQQKGYLKIERINKKEYKYNISQKPSFRVEQYTFEELAPLKDPTYYYQCLNAKIITYELYKELMQDFNNMVHTKWINK